MKIRLHWEQFDLNSGLSVHYLRCQNYSTLNKKLKKCTTLIIKRPGKEIHYFIEILTDNPFQYKLDNSKIIVSTCIGIIHQNENGVSVNNPWSNQCVLIRVSSSSGLQIRVRTGKLFSHFSTKTYVVGTQKNRLIETVLLSTQNTCFNWWVRK